MWSFSGGEVAITPQFLLRNLARCELTVRNEPAWARKGDERPSSLRRGRRPSRANTPVLPAANSGECSSDVAKAASFAIASAPALWILSSAQSETQLAELSQAVLDA